MSKDMTKNTKTLHEKRTNCPECKSEDVVEVGTTLTKKKGRLHNFICGDCKESFFRKF